MSSTVASTRHAQKMGLKKKPLADLVIQDTAPADAGTPWRPGAEPLSPAAGAAAPKGSRRRIWEVEQKFHCPLVGTCLPMGDVRRLAERHKVIALQAGDYDAHVAVVSHCQTRNNLSRALQKLLDQRHALWVGRFARVAHPTPPAETARPLALPTPAPCPYGALWERALASGEIPGAFWAIISLPQVPDTLRARAYQDVHMLSHQVGAGNRADLRRLSESEARLVDTRAQLQQLRERYDASLGARQRRIEELEQAFAGLASQLQAAQTSATHQLMAHQQQRLEAAQREVDELTRRARQQEQRAEALASRVAELEENNQQLTQHLASAEEEREALERLLLVAHPGVAADGGSSQGAPGACRETGETCPGDCDLPCQLHGQRVLCVGGRSNLAPRYRELAQRSGASFIWHDGGRDEGMGRLMELLNGADAVICPADCVSHSAYYHIKRHCKRVEKPCVLLRNSGLGSFAAGLKRLSEGRTEIAGPPLLAPPLPAPALPGMASDTPPQ